jgi:large subunit ribosomal protein L4
MDVPVMNLQGQQTDTLVLDDKRWASPTNKRLLSQAVAMYRANARSGTASTKTRGDVSGGGKKPWKQKHTGRARAGSTRSPLWRHGGSVFGPRPRNFGFHLPKKIRRAALLESLKGKLQDQQLVVLSELQASQPKTKPFAGLAKTFGVERSSLIVLEELQDITVRSLRNLASFTLRRADELNAFDVLNANKILVTRRALERVQNRIDGQPNTPIATVPGAAPEASATARRAPAPAKRPARSTGTQKAEQRRARASEKPATAKKPAKAKKPTRRKGA